MISASDRIVDEWRFTWMSVTGPCAATTPITTNAIGAVTSQRSSRAEIRPQTTTHVAMTTTTAAFRSLSTPGVSAAGNGRRWIVPLAI